jgi:hypothetical protein
VHWGCYYATTLDIDVDAQRRRFGCRESDFAAIMAIPYTGLSFAASCNSRSSHGQYTRSSTEHFEYGAVTSARLLGQNYRNRNYSKVRNTFYTSGKNSRNFHTLGYEMGNLQKLVFLHTQKILFHTLKNNFILYNFFYTFKVCFIP